MSSFYRDLAEIQRLTYVQKTGEYFATWDSYLWYLKPSNDDISSTGKGTMWKSFHFQTAVTADIRESDHLIIDSQTYTVRAVSKHKGINIQFLRALLTLDPWLI